MKVLLIGDVNGRSGREAVFKWLPEVKARYKIDFVVLNVDNAAHGFGITPSIADTFFKMGVNVMTGGNHIFDQKDIFPYLDSHPNLLRPHNLMSSAPGSGVVSVMVNDRKVVVIHLIGQVHMPQMPAMRSSSFDEVQLILQKYKLTKTADVILVDFHAEVTSEKNAFGHFLDGSVSVVVGTHTHIPTSDYRILEHGTAFQTDLGMTGDYNSVIGMEKNAAIERFAKSHTTSHLSSAIGEGTMCGVIVEIDEQTGLAKSISQVQNGGVLAEAPRGGSQA